MFPTSTPAHCLLASAHPADPEGRTVVLCTRAALSLPAPWKEVGGAPPAINTWDPGQPPEAPKVGQVQGSFPSPHLYKEDSSAPHYPPSSCKALGLPNVGSCSEAAPPQLDGRNRHSPGHRSWITQAPLPVPPIQPRARPACKQPHGKPATAAPRSPVLCPFGERLGAAQPLQQNSPPQQDISLWVLLAPSTHWLLCLPLGFFSFSPTPPPPHFERFECADAPAS